MLIDDAMEIVETLARFGHRALFAGGCVRDKLLARALHDIDIATSATPDEIEKIFSPRTIPIGKAFGVILVKAADSENTFEVATFRAEAEYKDGRHPEKIFFANAEADARRRDFTINGLFLDPRSGEIIDYVGGKDDLERGIIRAIGNPRDRFAEDKLRMLRAVRFATTLGFSLEEKTSAAIRETAAKLKQVSIERIAEEFTRMLVESRRPSESLELLRTLGLLEEFLPEAAELFGTPQDPQWHPEGDVWTHTMMMLDRIESPRQARFCYAVLLHDIGKPPTTREERGHIRSIGHDEVGAEMAREIMMRLKRPAEWCNFVEHLVRGHMQFVTLPKMRRARLRRALGDPYFLQQLALHKLDSACSWNGANHAADKIAEFAQSEYEKFSSEPILPQPLVSGRDLIARGVAPSPRLGELLRRAYDLQLEGENDKDAIINKLGAL